MMAAPTLLFLYSSLFIVSLHKSVAKPLCKASSCGIIPNISYPFYLKGHPNYCGHLGGELECDNNVIILYLNSHKYYVKAINYTTFRPTIRVVDSSINNQTCSFPTSSAYLYNFSAFSTSPFRVYAQTPISLMSCPHPLKNSSTFTDTTHCQTSNSRFTYVKIGSMNASDVRESCTVDTIVMTSREFKDSKNVSLEEIHHSLLYGFELEFCLECTKSKTAWDKFILFVYYRYRKPFLIFLAIFVISGAAVYPVMIIVAIPIVLVILMLTGTQLYYAIRHWDPHYLPVTLLSMLTNFSSYYHSNYYAWKCEFISTIIIVTGPRFIISLFLTWVLIYKFRRRHLSKSHTIETFLQSDNKLAPIRYSYSDIKKMTKNFREKLGEGGYGSVYRGKLRSGYHVAVKLLGKSGANDKDFMNEIATIGRIHHVNIVTLAGYCAEGSKRALVLDFMPNGSLEKYIFNKGKGKSLNGDMKFRIAVGVARGIEYLHQGCNIQILHFDIKPHNILLDDKFNPKVSDFGLAKFCSTEKNIVTLTAARGTIGYIAPELINRGIGRVSYKADVYSFGMLLMEMVGLNRDLKGKNDESSKYFPCWIYDCFDEDKDIRIESFEENDEDEGTRKLVRKMTIVALWCIQMNPEDRPSMNKVVEMLESEVEHLQIPHYPSVSPYEDEDENGGSSSIYSDSAYSDSVSLLLSTNVEIRVDD